MIEKKYTWMTVGRDKNLKLEAFIDA